MQRRECTRTVSRSSSCNPTRVGVASRWKSTLAPSAAHWALVDTGRKRSSPSVAANVKVSQRKRSSEPTLKETPAICTFVVGKRSPGPPLTTAPRIRPDWKTTAASRMQSPTQSGAPTIPTMGREPVSDKTPTSPKATPCWKCWSKRKSPQVLPMMAMWGKAMMSTPRFDALRIIVMIWSALYVSSAGFSRGTPAATRRKSCVMFVWGLKTGASVGPFARNSALDGAPLGSILPLLLPIHIFARKYTST